MSLSPPKILHAMRMEVIQCGSDDEDGGAPQLPRSRPVLCLPARANGTAYLGALKGLIRLLAKRAAKGTVFIG